MAPELNSNPSFFTSNKINWSGKYVFPTFLLQCIDPKLEWKVCQSVICSLLVSLNKAREMTILNP